VNAFYQSAWHHPGFAWLGNALLIVAFSRVVPKELRRYTALAIVTILLDAFFTGAFNPFTQHGVAQAFSIAFVILGDLRYFYLVERDRETRNPFLVATLLAFIVPLTQTAIMEWIYPAPFIADRRLIFLSYEALFVLFSSLLWVFRHGVGASRWRSGLFAFEIVQYVLWCSIDVLIVSGHEWALVLRLLPNALYYAGFLWFVVLSWRR